MHALCGFYVHYIRYVCVSRQGGMEYSVTWIGGMAWYGMYISVNEQITEAEAPQEHLVEGSGDYVMFFGLVIASISTDARTSTSTSTGTGVIDGV